MSIDNETVLNIARLARLNIQADEIDSTRKEIEQILGLVEKMNQVDTTEVEIMTHPFDATLRMRSDEVTEVDNREKFQRCAPSVESGLYLVPKVID